MKEPLRICRSDCLLVDLEDELNWPINKSERRLFESVSNFFGLANSTRISIDLLLILDANSSNIQVSLYAINQSALDNFIPSNSPQEIEIEMESTFHEFYDFLLHAIASWRWLDGMGRDKYSVRRKLNLDGFVCQTGCYVI